MLRYQARGACWCERAGVNMELSGCRKGKVKQLVLPCWKAVLTYTHGCFTNWVHFLQLVKHPGVGPVARRTTKTE